MILIPFLSLFLVSASALRCYVCENAKNLLECHSPNGGKVVECNSNEKACQTHVRRGSYGYLYEKRCKERHACHNNQIQNPRPASHPSQCNKEGDTSVCRCCCFTDKCMAFQGCPGDQPPTIAPDVTTTKAPVEQFCKPPEICDKCSLDCGESRPDGNYSLQHECKYECPPEAYGDKYESSGIITCRLGSLNGYKENVFLPPLPKDCEVTPNATCRDPPVWEDGIVLCHPPAPDGRGDGNWDFQDTCDFICPENYTLVGDAVSICDERLNPITGEVVVSFEPQHPCCEPPCDPRSVADITFVLDSSTSVGKTFWPDVTQFLSDVTRSFNVGPNAVQFGVITFGLRTYKLDSRIIKLNAAANNQQLESELERIKDFYSEGKGTNTIEALLDTSNMAFTTDFGNRDDVDSKIIIFVTDGRSNIKHDSYTVKTASDKLKTEATTVFAIGIGSKIKLSELETIASNDDQVIIYKKFGDLDAEKIRAHLQEIACNRKCL